MSNPGSETSVPPPSTEIVAVYDTIWREIEINEAALSPESATSATNPSPGTSTGPQNTPEGITYKAFSQAGGTEATYSCTASADRTKFDNFQLLAVSDAMKAYGYWKEYRLADVVDDNGFLFLRWKTKAIQQGGFGTWGWSKRRVLATFSAGSERLEGAKVPVALKDWKKANEEAWKKLEGGGAS